MATLLERNLPFEVRVSSVLNRDVKSFGKQFIFDKNDDTCWNSDKGTPQWLSVELSETQTISGFTIQFQGGFVGQDCSVQLSNPGSIDIMTEPFYPEDVNTPQIFKLSNPSSAKHLKFIFGKSTDFFGRIVIYSMDILLQS